MAVPLKVIWIEVCPCTGNNTRAVTRDVRSQRLSHWCYFTEPPPGAKNWFTVDCFRRRLVELSAQKRHETLRRLARELHILEFSIHEAHTWSPCRRVCRNSGVVCPTPALSGWQPSLFVIVVLPGLLRLARDISPSIEIISPLGSDTQSARQGADRRSAACHQPCRNARRRNLPGRRPGPEVGTGEMVLGKTPDAHIRPYMTKIHAGNMRTQPIQNLRGIRSFED